jgi:hypothetical protein
MAWSVGIHKETLHLQIQNMLLLGRGKNGATKQACSFQFIVNLTVFRQMDHAAPERNSHSSTIFENI